MSREQTAVTVKSQLPEMLYLVGVKSFWRKSFDAFFSDHQRVYVGSPSDVPRGSVALCWGYKYEQNEFAEGVKLYRVEDGFVRSVGLGAEFARPMSWVLDSQALYFDATQVSDLETQLNKVSLTKQQTKRAESLIELLLRTDVSKYNTGAGDWTRPTSAKHVILVPGQVESDASIQRGSPEVKTNLSLIKAVRSANPQAYVVYKPHPDVVAGAREQGSDEHNCFQIADEVITDVPIQTLFKQVDEVHTMTSLAGFEALLRGLKVTCYGIPFYAGWGLTHDYINCARRSRKLSLEDLVYCALIHYPMYIHPQRGGQCEVEDVIDYVVCQRNSKSFTRAVEKQFKRWVRRALNWVGGK